MAEKRVSLYERLPEIYRIKDAEQTPPYQLRAYLALVESAFGAIHDNIENLYHDFFIDTCDPWVIPYIGDLLGNSPLIGDSRTLRADVADTVALRRRKGTQGAIEKLTFDLTGWAVHVAELRKNLVWAQNLNHQRPDLGGTPPYGDRSVVAQGVVRGGTASVRKPGLLTLIGTPFDGYAHLPDFRPIGDGAIHYNLPNVAVFLWRIADYRISAVRPGTSAQIDYSQTAQGDAARFAVRFYVHPLDRRLRLFNTYQYDPESDPQHVTQVDETPNPISVERIAEGFSSDTRQGKYVAIDVYDPQGNKTIGAQGFQIHVRSQDLSSPIQEWRVRGANLCAWETMQGAPLLAGEVMIDPDLGRFVVGVKSAQDAANLAKNLMITYSYGAVGPVGAHPVNRPSSPAAWDGETTAIVRVPADRPDLASAIQGISKSARPVIVEITDSATYSLDLGDAALAGDVEAATGSLLLNASLAIRSATGQRPVVRLAQPLRFRPAALPASPDDDGALDALKVRLEGVYLTRDEKKTAYQPGSGQALIARAAVHHLEIVDCTLDPGGSLKPDGSRTVFWPSIKLEDGFGFSADDLKKFDRIPRLSLLRTIAGQVLVDYPQELSLTDSILDAGSGVETEPAAAAYAVGPVGASISGPDAEISGITVFGKMKVFRVAGGTVGGIWVHALEVENNQSGCIRYSCFSGEQDRLPQYSDCVPDRVSASLRFTSDVFETYAYGQLARTCDSQILEQGPQRIALSEDARDPFFGVIDPNYSVIRDGRRFYKLGDQMGAFGFLLEAHKWKNLAIRYREFMPVGARPILIPVN